MKVNLKGASVVVFTTLMSLAAISQSRSTFQSAGGVRGSDIVAFNHGATGSGNDGKATFATVNAGSGGTRGVAFVSPIHGGGKADGVIYEANSFDYSTGLVTSGAFGGVIFAVTDTPMQTTGVDNATGAATAVPIYIFINPLVDLVSNMPSDGATRGRSTSGRGGSKQRSDLWLDDNVRWTVSNGLYWPLQSSLFLQR